MLPKLMKICEIMGSRGFEVPALWLLDEDDEDDPVANTGYVFGPSTGTGNGTQLPRSPVPMSFTSISHQSSPYTWTDRPQLGGVTSLSLFRGQTPGKGVSSATFLSLCGGFS